MIREGTRVRWKWGNSHAEAKVVERHESTVSRTIKGSEITRHGSADNPALVLEQDDGQAIIKLDSEVERAEQSSPSTTPNRPIGSSRT